MDLKNYNTLLQDFEFSPYYNLSGKLLTFTGTEGLDKYNPCAISINKEIILAVRVETRDSIWTDPEKYKPEIKFFKENGEVWQYVPELPTLTIAEDPFAQWVNTNKGLKLLFGYVTAQCVNMQCIFETRLFLVENLNELAHAQPFLVVPMMKDIRFLQLLSGEIVVCGRPQGQFGGIGRINMVKIYSLELLTENALWEAPIISPGVEDVVKMGTNELYELENGLIGALGHTAYKSPDGNLHYMACVWTIDLQTNAMSPITIIAQRKNFPDGPAKTPDLADVVFPGSLIPLENSKVRLFSGLSDVSVGSIDIPFPFDSHIIVRDP